MPIDLPGDFYLDLLRKEDIEAAFEIETEVFPSDEAASLEAFRYRQSNAPDLFFGAFQHPRTILGYVTSTLSSAPSLSHESMSNHDPEGTSVCIHSVAVKPSFQHRGIALALLNEYVQRLKDLGDAERILLITHEELRGLYAKAGFELVGKSAVTHGSRDWYEMRILLEKERAATTSLPPDIPQEALIAALSAPSKGRPKSRALSSFESIAETTVDVGGKRGNKFKLVCLSERCGSVILLSKTSELREAPSITLEPPTHPAPAPLPALPAVGTPTSWWLATGSPMVFENVSFSRPVPIVDGGASSGPPLKLLSCGECDIGPVGWCLQGEQEFWVHSERVGYVE